ncbi:GerAB/ArcD/ProY family transporter [Bacillus sp. EB01]|uniref:GerAB/ArcD/ProY family transporter n=1 Tax=Bacillus sp. EB01 TaxID=1347086 RepID=UPI0005C6FE00|nr:GerAB/ArcD/ProY family transporter [Bacillus sp. EB01]
MGDFILFDKTAQLGKGYIIAFANRSQMLYFILFLPKFLEMPYLLLGILAVGILSQINLFILSKCLSSKYTQQGYHGFADLLGRRTLRMIAFAGIAFIFIKMSMIILGYAEIVHQFIFPAMQRPWIILLILLISTYIASQGMEKTLRFGIIAFLCTFWIILLYIPYFFPPAAELHDLYPLIPTDWSHKPWKGILMVWSSLSGPEYLILLLPWINSKQKMLRYLSIANAISILEYLLLFLACLFFFGTTYLGKIGFPVVNMIRYLQSPVFERVEIIMISLHMFHYVFFISVLLLCLYGAIRISAGTQYKETTRKGFFAVCLLVLAGVFLIQLFYWREGKELNRWANVQLWSGAFTYLLIPSLLLAATKIKGRRSSL